MVFVVVEAPVVVEGGALVVGVGDAPVGVGVVPIVVVGGVPVLVVGGAAVVLGVLISFVVVCEMVVVGGTSVK